tara:strand:- start:148 stop:504 length:357 start_codon:yes stop_codon:yes gene_type:complete
MKSKVYLIKNVSFDVQQIIQKFLINKWAIIAINNYFNYLFYFKDLYENFVINNYIEPRCRCIRYYNSFAGRWKTRECYLCDEFECSDKYIPTNFIECIEDNQQYDKICWQYKNLKLNK